MTQLWWSLQALRDLEAIREYIATLPRDSAPRSALNLSRDYDLGTRELQEIAELGVGELDERRCVDRWALSQG